MPAFSAPGGPGTTLQRHHLKHTRHARAFFCGLPDMSLLTHHLKTYVAASRPSLVTLVVLTQRLTFTKPSLKRALPSECFGGSGALHHTPHLISFLAGLLHSSCSLRQFNLTSCLEGGDTNCMALHIVRLNHKRSPGTSSLQGIRQFARGTHVIFFQGLCIHSSRHPRYVYVAPLRKHSTPHVNPQNTLQSLAPVTARWVTSSTPGHTRSS